MGQLGSHGCWRWARRTPRAEIRPRQLPLVDLPIDVITGMANAARADQQLGHHVRAAGLRSQNQVGAFGLAFVSEFRPCSSASRGGDIRSPCASSVAGACGDSRRRAVLQQVDRARPAISAYKEGELAATS